VTDADGDDVLIGIQQYAQRQIDNFRYEKSEWGIYTYALIEDTKVI
jgi:hypothetical protein